MLKVVRISAVLSVGHAFASKQNSASKGKQSVGDPTINSAEESRRVLCHKKEEEIEKSKKMLITFQSPVTCTSATLIA